MCSSRVLTDTTVLVFLTRREPSSTPRGAAAPTSRCLPHRGGTSSPTPFICSSNGCNHVSAGGQSITSIAAWCERRGEASPGMSRSRLAADVRRRNQWRRWVSVTQVDKPESKCHFRSNLLPMSVCVFFFKHHNDIFQSLALAYPHCHHDRLV